MFAVLYYFETKENTDRAFIEAWTELTSLIYQYEGSLGSRLHKKSEGCYIAYAQWPGREAWAASGKNLPDHAQKVSAKMRGACSKNETISLLYVVQD